MYGVFPRRFAQFDLSMSTPFLLYKLVLSADSNINQIYLTCVCAKALESSTFVSRSSMYYIGTMAACCFLPACLGPLPSVLNRILKVGKAHLPRSEHGLES